MTNIFINLGEGFKDEKIKIYSDEMAKRMENKVFNFSREKLNEINAITDDYVMVHFDTNGCEKKNRLKALATLITELTLRVNCFYFLPKAPMDLVGVVIEKWPDAEIFRFEYDKMKPAIRIC